MKMFTRKCGIAIVGAVLSFNVYASITSTIGKKLMKEILEQGATSSMQQIGKHHGLTELMLKDLGGVYHMDMGHIMKNLLDSDAKDILNKQAKSLSKEDMINLTDAISKAMIRASEEKPGISYRPCSKDSFYCVKPGDTLDSSLGGTGVRANLSFLDYSLPKAVEKTNLMQRKGYLKRFASSKGKPLLIGPRKKVYVTLSNKVRTKFDDIALNKVYYALKLAEGSQKQALNNDSPVGLAKEALNLYMKKDKLGRNALVIDESFLKIAQLMADTQKDNISEVRRLLKEANGKISKNPKLTNDQRAQTLYSVFRKKNKKLADQLDENNCYW